MRFRDRAGRSRWTLVPLLLATAALIGGAAVPLRRDDPSTWTAAEWHAWRDTQIATIFQTEPDAKGDRRLSRAGVFIRSRQAAEFLAAQAPTLLKDPAMRNFVSFVQAQSLMASHGHSLGMKVSDREYWRSSASNLEFPALLRSQEFLAKLADPTRYNGAVKAIEENNRSLSKEKQWVVVPFIAGFVTSVDKTTYGRLLVYVPNEPGPDNSVFDKWIMFAIATPDMATTPEIRSVSMVSVHRLAGRKAKTYFMDFFRERDRHTGNIRILPTALLPVNPSKNCYDCHKSGVLPLHPDAQMEFTDKGTMIVRKPTVEVFQKLNSLIRSYGPQDRGDQDLAAYGPSLAPKDGEHSRELIRQATKGLELSEESLERIKGSMNCGSCHQEFAPINYPQAVQTKGDLAAFKRKEGMLQTYVENGWMPANNDLTPAERKGLWRSLVKEYFDAETQTGTLIDWLKGIAR
jgi:hypothetical protein